MTGPPAKVNISAAKRVHATIAPVSDELSGKEKAGVKLTMIVLGIISVFLAVVLLFAGLMELRGGDLWSPGTLVGTTEDTTLAGGRTAIDTVAFRLLQAERQSFREFWLRMVQMVLLNVLLPVLTALLGYVFGTQTTRQRE